MAEAVLGSLASSITIAAAFASCIEAFKMISLSKSQAADLEMLFIKLRIEQCRLYQWGRACGLTDQNKQPEQHAPISLPNESLAKEILNSIFLLLTNAEKLRSRYGCYSVPWGSKDVARASVGPSAPMEELARNFNDFKLRVRERQKMLKTNQKLRWLVKDSARFHHLISHLKDLVDGLEAVTRSIPCLSSLDTQMRDALLMIEDSDALESIKQACSESHHDYADTVSLKLEGLSAGLLTNDAVEAWRQGVAGSEPDFLTNENWEQYSIGTLASINSIAIRLYGKDSLELPLNKTKDIALAFWNIILLKLHSTAAERKPEALGGTVMEPDEHKIDFEPTGVQSMANYKGVLKTYGLPSQKRRRKAGVQGGGSPASSDTD